MYGLPKEFVGDFVKEGNFKSIKDIENTLIGIIQDTIQEALEAGIKEELRYSKYDLASSQPTISEIKNTRKLSNQAQETYI